MPPRHGQMFFSQTLTGHLWLPRSQFARVVKGLDLRSTTRKCAWVRAPQLTSDSPSKRRFPQGKTVAPRPVESRLACFFRAIPWSKAKSASSSPQHACSRCVVACPQQSRQEPWQQQVLLDALGVHMHSKMPDSRKSVCPSGQGGGLKIHCRKLRVVRTPQLTHSWQPATALGFELGDIWGDCQLRDLRPCISRQWQVN